MKTIIVGDLHLGSEANTEDHFIFNWFKDIIEKERPDHIILNGDIFEISFYLGGKRTEKVNPSEILDNIVKSHRNFAELIAKVSGNSKITYVIGEHDYFLLKLLKDDFYKYFDEKNIELKEYFFEPVTKSLIFHGHQFDYNCIPDYSRDEVLTDKLTRVFENFVFHDKEEEILDLFKNQGYSFWYSAGSLPDYVNASEKIFGTDHTIYYTQLSELIKSDFFISWIDQMQHPLNKAVAKVVKFMAFLSPNQLEKVSKVWWRISKNLFHRRGLRFLKKGADRRLLDVSIGEIDNLILSHAHENYVKHFNNGKVSKQYFNIVAPRWHFKMYQEDKLELVRNDGYIVIDTKLKTVRNNFKSKKKVITLNRAS